MFYRWGQLYFLDRRENIITYLYSEINYLIPGIPCLTTVTMLFESFNRNSNMLHPRHTKVKCQQKCNFHRKHLKISNGTLKPSPTWRVKRSCWIVRECLFQCWGCNTELHNWSTTGLYPCPRKKIIFGCRNWTSRPPAFYTSALPGKLNL
jgi:hypothetical protein